MGFAKDFWVIDIKLVVERPCHGDYGDKQIPQYSRNGG